MSDKNEIWQVMIQGEVYETDMDCLKQWVAERRVLPTDQVRKGNLKWIRADRAPAMRHVFSGEWSPSPPPATPASVVLQDEPYDSTPQSHDIVDEPFADDVPASDPLTATPASSAACYHHPQALPEHICRACGATFCRECPKTVGVSKIALCPLCGDLCQPYQELQERVVRQSYQQSGFGLGDFAQALRHPLKDKISLVAAAMFYGFLLLAGFWGQMLSYMIMFGCISLVINRVSSGRMDRHFLPDFSSFSWWDDVFIPATLGIGITIVTIGPIIVLLIAIWFGLLSGPGLMSLDPAQTQGNEQSQLTAEDMEELMNPTDEKKSEEAAKKLNQLHPASQMNEEIENSKDSSGSLISSVSPFLHAPATLALLFLLAIFWAIFYYPMALAVAGYTEDFWSTVNPLIGLDTIRRMGLVYVKAFLMCLCMMAAGLVLSTIIYIATAPFDMPFVGNLPARFLDGMVTFYINLVIACILGLALYKCADKLDIPTE